MLGTESILLIHPEDRKKARENAVKMLKGESTTPTSSGSSQKTVR